QCAVADNSSSKPITKPTIEKSLKISSIAFVSVCGGPSLLLRGRDGVLELAAKTTGPSSFSEWITLGPVSVFVSLLSPNSRASRMIRLTTAIADQTLQRWHNPCKRPVRALHVTEIISRSELSDRRARFRSAESKKGATCESDFQEDFMEWLFASGVDTSGIKAGSNAATATEETQHAVHHGR
ncbi:MAG TPA: hypothetical protein VE422_15740, partial [Terriglobia bacterium]|nr:hypothetical protein [Terriglobia bacterium]